jgi:hypothetical protein
VTLNSILSIKNSMMSFTLDGSCCLRTSHTTWLRKMMFLATKQHFVQFCLRLTTLSLWNTFHVYCKCLCPCLDVNVWFIKKHLNFLLSHPFKNFIMIHKKILMAFFMCWMTWMSNQTNWASSLKRRLLDVHLMPFSSTKMLKV